MKTRKKPKAQDKQKKQRVQRQRAKRRREASAKSYCPYCNNCKCKEMTDEHVIPKSIGGDERFVIRVCKPCNSKVGDNIDTLLSKHTSFRMMGKLSQRKFVKRKEQHKSTAILKDGRSLNGYIYWRHVQGKTFKPSFEPKKKQRDGSLWISEHAVKRSGHLPNNINILKDDMVLMPSFVLSPPHEKGLEPAMIKIILGIIYFDQGKSITSSSSFDRLRYCLSGRMHCEISFKWLSTQELEKRVVRKKKERKHIIWFGCPNGVDFNAGVSFFGRGTIELWIKNFGCKIPNRCCFFLLQ